MKQLDDFLKVLENNIVKQETLEQLKSEINLELQGLREERLIHVKALEMIRVSEKYGIRYLTRKQETAKQNINSTIAEIDKLIGDESGARLELGDGKMMIVDRNRVPINDIEGGGYRACLATQLQLTTLLVSDLEKIAILDEPISALNNENSERFSNVLLELSKHMQLFFVTQDPDYLEETSTRYIKLEKENGVSRVVKDNRAKHRENEL